MDSANGPKLCAADESRDKRGSQSAVSIFFRNINMKVGGIVSANISDMAKISDISEMIQCGRVFQAARKITGGAPAIIDGEKEAVTMIENISSEPFLSEVQPFCLAAKMALHARREENVIYIAQVGSKISKLIGF